MTVDGTPESRSQRSSSTSSISATTNRAPTTPKIPFDPPHRRSSLAFSRVIDPSATDGASNRASATVAPVDVQTADRRSNIGKKRTIQTLLGQSGMLFGHEAQAQKVFQTARANLQLDMHFAASPSGSIGSRLPQANRGEENQRPECIAPEKPKKYWRYSTMPTLFSTAAMDVREPLPDSSPTLPKISSGVSENPDIMPIEPSSSGFASPVSVSGNGGSIVDPLCLPASPSPSFVHPDPDKGEEADRFHASGNAAEEIKGLTEPMTELKVDNDDVLSDRMDDSPTINHLSRKSRYNSELLATVPDFPNAIFLSQSAKAAAESAKAKRGLLKQAFDKLVKEGNTSVNGLCPDPAAHHTATSNCPDPGVHRPLHTRLCPDPAAHLGWNSPGISTLQVDTMKAHSFGQENGHLTRMDFVNEISTAPLANLRTTANGSPMPLSRRAFGPVSSPASQYSQPRFPSSPPADVYRFDRFREHPRRHIHVPEPSEHFRPGWYYADKFSSDNQRLFRNLYSFSTAAAKVTGESIAPDSRIRDSYRTDTLMPLALPQGRFRKTGITATLQQQNRRRHDLGPGLPRRPSHRVALGKTRADPHHMPGMNFRSSPLRPSTRHAWGHNIRKRPAHGADMLGFDIAEDDSAVSTRPSIRFRSSEEVMRVDENTGAAIRMSLFGQRASCSPTGESDGMRELSPNVNLWRKGMSGGSHYRKKRRPSYWDNDLEEVRMSPAGRGGIESSPVMSKRSMVAELEDAPTRANTAVSSGILDENTLDKPYGDPNEGREAEMADAVELEG